MTRSIFDPTGGYTEHSGNRNMGPQADNLSHMPPGVVDGDVSDEEAAEQAAGAQGVDALEANAPSTPGLDPAAVEQKNVPQR